MLNAVKHPGWHSEILRSAQYDTLASYLRPPVLARDVQQQADMAYELWKLMAYHPSLQFKRIDSETPTYSVRVGRSHRALCWRQGDTVVWFWIGDHDEYDRILR